MLTHTHTLPELVSTAQMELHSLLLVEPHNVHAWALLAADLHDGDHIAVSEDDVHDAAGKEDGEV